MPAFKYKAVDKTGRKTRGDRTFKHAPKNLVGDRLDVPFSVDLSHERTIDRIENSRTSAQGVFTLEQVSYVAPGGDATEADRRRDLQ